MAAPLPQGLPVWDPVVKFTHWAIAAVVLGNAVLTEGGSVLHVTIGWLGLSLLVVRLVWGLFAPGPARLTTFLPDPRAALSHLTALARGRHRDYPSHNPAGALMVWTLWAALAVVVGTGLWMTGGTSPMKAAADAQIVATGDWTTLAVEDDDDGDDDRGEWLEEVHEVAGNLMLVLALIHVAGVAGESMLQRRNLLRPMLPGRRR